MKNSLNSPIRITAIGFDGAMRSYPTRMEWQGRTYHFISHGLWLNVFREGRGTRTVTCSDGQQDFCLRQVGHEWTLMQVG